jgi:hypothetical protein
MSNYTIKLRGDTPPNSDHDPDFPDRMYNFPLVGCDNYYQDIQIGDIVGVLISSEKNYVMEADHKNFFTDEGSVSFIENHSQKFKSIERSLNFCEEHFFRVIDTKDSSYIVEKVFLDGEKVIVKLVQDFAALDYDIPIEIINKREYVSTIGNVFEETCYPNPISHLIELLDSGKTTEKKQKNLKRFLKYEDYRHTYFKMTDDELKMFFDCIERNKELIIETLGELNFQNLGTYELVIENVNEKINQVFSAITSPTIPAKIHYPLHIPSHLGIPSINHNIAEISYEEIFRVYKEDPSYFVTKVSEVSNWSGVTLDETVRKYITPGNIVRVAIKGEYQCVIYFRILMKVEEFRYLAEIENYYLSKFENIVIVIDSRGITEIPLEWEGNGNLLQFDLKQGDGFSVTGLGALVDDGELFPLTYSDLSFGNQ